MKILFVCLTGKCRSPLAAGLLKTKLQERNLESEVDSAGFEVYHINEPPDYRAVQVARHHGIDITEMRARLFAAEDFDNFDRIYTMDTVTFRNAMYFIRSKEDAKKIDFLMNMIKPGRNEPVPDPFYRQLGAYEETFNILDDACEKIVDQISISRSN